MQDIYDNDLISISDNLGFPTMRRSVSRLSRYQLKAVENAAMAVFDMQAEEIKTTSAISSHVKIAGLTRQATEMYPEAADRFQALADQNCWNLIGIIKDSYEGR